MQTTDHGHACRDRKGTRLCQRRGTATCGAFPVKKSAAVVVKQKPFTIRLVHETPKITQILFGGTDPGRTKVGEAVIGRDGNMVCEAEVESRNRKIPKLMRKRAAHRGAFRQGERKACQRRARANGILVPERLAVACVN